MPLLPEVVPDDVLGGLVDEVQQLVDDDSLLLPGLDEIDPEGLSVAFWHSAVEIDLADGVPDGDYLAQAQPDGRRAVLIDDQSDRVLALLDLDPNQRIRAMIAGPLLDAFVDAIGVAEDRLAREAQPYRAVWLAEMRAVISSYHSAACVAASEPGSLASFRRMHFATRSPGWPKSSPMCGRRSSAPDSDIGRELSG